jgi:hypothetical protein
MRVNQLRSTGRSLGLSLALALASVAQADDAAAPPAPEQPGITNGADIYVYPAKGQTDQQLDRDRYECHGWAAKQTGYDPTQPNLAPHQQVQVVPMPPDHRGAVNGAIAGAVIGATVSGPHDAAQGAMVGAVAGAMAGVASDVARSHEAAGNAAHKTTAEQAEQARLEKQAYDYRRAISACLEGRGYTVK